MSRLDRITEAQWQKLALDAKGSVAALSKRCGVSARQLERHLRKQKGVTPLKWLNELRLGHAPKLLTDGLTVKEAAERLGYEDASHFAKAFRRYHGVPPSKFGVAEQ
jgi:AraC-like DNA-binding protein